MLTSREQLSISTRICRIKRPSRTSCVRWKVDSHGRRHRSRPFWNLDCGQLSPALRPRFHLAAPRVSCSCCWTKVTKRNPAGSSGGHDCSLAHDAAECIANSDRHLIRNRGGNPRDGKNPSTLAFFAMTELPCRKAQNCIQMTGFASEGLGLMTVCITGVGLILGLLFSVKEREDCQV